MVGFYHVLKLITLFHRNHMLWLIPRLDPRSVDQ
jgi:hypothetical protein